MFSGVEELMLKGRVDETEILEVEFCAEASPKRTESKNDFMIATIEDESDRKNMEELFEQADGYFILHIYCKYIPNTCAGVPVCWKKQMQSVA